PTLFVSGVLFRCHVDPVSLVFVVFSFNHPAPTLIYTLSLHDALPISFPGNTGPSTGPAVVLQESEGVQWGRYFDVLKRHALLIVDRKSTRLNSSHGSISYAVFCLKKKKKKQKVISHTDNLQWQ